MLYLQDGMCDRKFRVFKHRSATRPLSQDGAHFASLAFSLAALLSKSHPCRKARIEQRLLSPESEVVSIH
jgi:hypothetical protein